MIAYTLVDREGLVVSSGTTMHLEIAGPGQTAIEGHAPPESRWDFEVSAWVPLVAPARTLDDLKQDALTSLAEAYGRAVQALHAGSTPAERQTWATQRAEVLSGTPGPFITAMAEARGIHRDDAFRAVKDAVARYDTQAAELLGRWQAARDFIRTAQSREDMADFNIKDFIE